MLNPYEVPTGIPFDTNPPVSDARVGFAEKSAGVIACAMPLICYGYVVVFWVLASAALGEWARPGIHDPGDFFFGIPLAIEMVLMLLSFSAAPIVFFLGQRRGKIAIHFVAYFGCLALAIVLFRLDILQITTWITD